MAASQIVDFADIVSMVMEEMKYQSSDSTSEARIKRDINALYLHEVIPFKRWTWLSGNTSVQQKAFLDTGTASVVQDSATVTLSSAPTTSKANYLFTVDGYDEIYTISAHTAATATVTLSSAYTGTTNATASFRIWTDTVALPTDCRETIEVWHDFRTQPLEAVGIQEFRRRALERPQNAEKPLWYAAYDFFDPSSGNGETESDRYRVLKVHPSMLNDTITLHIDYVKQTSALDADGDEPAMPLEDRIVLVYGALSRSWARERNPEEAARNRMLFEQKLARMAGRIEDSFDKPQLIPDNHYVSKKRGSRIRRVRR